MVCRLLGVSRSAFYRSRKQVESEKIREEEAVINCFKTNNGNYGRIRIRKALALQDIRVSENRIARILKMNGLAAKAGRKRKNRRPKPTEEQYIEENLCKDKFLVTQANALWCSDICELRCRIGKIYICGIIDVATRRLVGWDIAGHQRQDLVQEAFRMAIGRNPKLPKGAIYHSDRGCQYTAIKTKDLIEKSGFLKSMSRPGTPNDNQPIESFWKTLRTELPDIGQLGKDEATRRIVAYIELYYNSSRLHSGIGYKVPNEYFEVLTLSSVSFS